MIRLFPALHNYLSSLEPEFDLIPAERKYILEKLGSYMSVKRANGQRINLIVVCTHNSRRSHFGQAWLMAAASFAGLDQLNAFSGGTTSTAFHPNAVNALEKAGFRISRSDNQEGNPVMALQAGADLPVVKMFSKEVADAENPKSNFAAVMVCNEADAACPIIPGAEARFSIPYEDPKIADGTPEADGVYAERCRQIAREMYYAVSFAVSGAT